MKLLSLHIDKYKNLTGDYDFTTQDGYIALIGENGSGKSNLLEAISLIFGKLYKISNIEDIGKFRIRYEIDDTEYSYGNIDGDGNDVELEANPRLPSSIISCYSGEDMRLWHMVYENYYMQYFKKALRDKTFSPKLMYINKYCWKIAFIALLCSNKDEVKNFLKDCCHYNDITDVSIKFAVDPTKRAMFVDHLACRWYDTISQNVDENGEINANIFASTDMTTYGATSQYAPNYVFQFLYLLSLPKKDTAKKQTVDKLINDITINVNGVNFDGLSEGEKKMILIECITQILGDKNSLVLLDEPDAHIHIARKKDLLEAIETFEGQTILTTHSPVFANKLKDHNIISLKRGKMESMYILSRIKELSGGLINYFDGTFLLDSKNPLILVEGIGDINYINKAIEVLKPKKPEYANISWDILCMGGAGENAKQYVDKLRPLIKPDRKVVVLLDRDESGAEAMKKFGFVGGRENFKTYKDGNWHFLMLPKTDEHTDIDFTIEDYFSIVYKKQIAQNKIEESGGFFKRLPKDLRQNVKDTLGKHIDEYTEAEMTGFSILIDKILNTLDGIDANIEEVIR